MRRRHQINVCLNDAERERLQALAAWLGLEQCDALRFALTRAADELRRKGEHVAA